MVVKAVFVVLSILVLFRLLLPYIVLYFANKALQKISTYTGSIEEVKISLINGIIIFKNFSFDKKERSAGNKKPFFESSFIKIDFKWKSIIRRSLVGLITINNPVLNFVKEPSEIKDKEKKSRSLKQMLEAMDPFAVNIKIENGTINYVNSTGKSNVNVTVSSIACSFFNLSNRYHTNNALPAHMQLIGNVYEGTLDFKMKLNPLAERLTFEMSTELKDINLVCLNRYLKSRANIDVNEGKFSMYTEVTSKNGEFNGYIKPVFTNLDLVGADDRNDSLLTRLWEGFVAVTIQILKNKKSDQLATKIKISGKLDNPHINIVSGVLTILKNGFIQAVKPSLDDVINVDSIRESVEKSGKFFKKLFNRAENS